MTTALAASTVLALAGSSHGFLVNQFAIQPNASISPDVGSFYNYYTGYLAATNLVKDNRTYWKNYRSIVESTTWLAADRLGGGGTYFGTLPGPGADPDAPEWHATTGNELGGGANVLGGGLTTIPSLDGGTAGYTWGAGSSAAFLAPSQVSPVNGSSVDSVFFGNFVFTDPGATGLVGTDLYVQIDGVNHFLPLDGSKGSGGYAIEYEPFAATDGSGRHGLRGFVVVPTPGSMGLLGIAGLAAIRRRR